MIDAYQLAIVAIVAVGALVIVVGVIWARSIQISQQALGEMLRRINDSQTDIAHTQQVISQGQKELTAIMQQLVTQVSVMQARQEGWRHPNE